jgi:hypothetical protein
VILFTDSYVPLFRDPDDVPCGRACMYWYSVRCQTLDLDLPQLPDLIFVVGITRSQTLFPTGGLFKSEVREIAPKYRAESMGICFIENKSISMGSSVSDPPQNLVMALIRFHSGQCGLVTL